MAQTQDITINVVYQALKIIPGNCYIIGVEDGYTEQDMRELEIRLDNKFAGLFVVAKGLVSGRISSNAISELAS